MLYLTDCWSLLQYSFTKHNGEFICDIQDGENFKKIKDSYFFVPEHIGLILNTDGIVVFKSSKLSLWPVLLSIVNLPPNIRMNKDYILLAGVWFGSVKPPLMVTLKALLDKIDSLYMTGVEVMTPVGKKTARAKLLLTVCDLPAKAMVLNQKQYNAYYVCNYCLDKGYYSNRIYQEHITKS